MILDLYKDSLEYSAKDWRNLVFLGIFTIFNFFVIPVFLIAGYNYRVIKTATHGIINGRDSLPKFDDFANMFIDGIKVLVIEFVYLIVIFIVFLIFTITGAKVADMGSGAVLYFGWLLTFILGIVAFLMCQMGICNMAYNNGAFSKAFALKELKGVIDKIGWFESIITYLGIIIISVVISVVTSALIFAIFTVLGISAAVLHVNPAGIFILGVIIISLINTFFIGPYLNIFSSRCVGLLYATQTYTDDDLEDDILDDDEMDDVVEENKKLETDIINNEVETDIVKKDGEEKTDSMNNNEIETDIVDDNE